MASPAAQTYLTPEEYIALEREAIPDAETVRSEYIKGKIIPRSSSNRAHNLITGNILGELHTHLKGTECFVFANEMRVSTPSDETPTSIQMSLSSVRNPVLKMVFLTRFSTLLSL